MHSRTLRVHPVRLHPQFHVLLVLGCNPEGLQRLCVTFPAFIFPDHQDANRPFLFHQRTAERVERKRVDPFGCDKNALLRKSISHHAVFAPGAGGKNEIKILQPLLVSRRRTVGFKNGVVDANPAETCCKGLREKADVHIHFMGARNCRFHLRGGCMIEKFDAKQPAFVAAQAPIKRLAVHANPSITLNPE